MRFERIVKEENIACDFARTGHLEVACKQAHFDDYARQVEVIAREFNHQLRVVPRDQLRGEIGSGIYYGGMVDEISAGPQSRALRCRTRQPPPCAAAPRSANARGCRTFSVNHGTVRLVSGLTASRGAMWARNVLVGTSGYTGAATPALRKKIIPIGSFIITTEVLSEALARELSPRNRQIYDSKNYLYYYRLTPDNRMLFGGRAAFFPETDQHRPQERRNSAPGNDRRLSATARHPESNTSGAVRSIFASTSCRTPGTSTASILP